MKVAINFTEISSKEQLFATLKEKLQLPDYFGDNLDALYDVLTGEVEMPLDLVFLDMKIEQLDRFEEVLSTLEDVDIVGFEFSYFLKTYNV